MLQSFIVYSIFLVSLYSLGNKYSNQIYLSPKNVSFWRYNVVLSIFIFTVISALRHDVGVDYLHYLETYQSTTSYFNIYDTSEFELGFNLVQKLFHNFDLHFSIFFGFFALLQIFFVYVTFKNEQYLYGCIGFVLLTSGLYFTMMNEIRQSVVACLFLYMVQFVHKKEIIKYLIICFLASFIHISAIILVPILFYLNNDKDIFKSIHLQLLIFTLSIIISDLRSLFDIFDNYGNLISQFTTKDTYSDVSARLDIWQKTHSRGIRYYTKILIYLLIIINSKKIKNYFNNGIIIKYYNLFFLGCIFYFLTINNTLLQRPFRFFMFFEIALGAYALFYFLKKSRITALAYICFSLIFFSAYVFSDHHTLYSFFWQA